MPETLPAGPGFARIIARLCACAGVAVEVTHSIEVRKGPTEVFALIDDPMRYPQWVESAKAVEAKGPDSFHVVLKEKGPGMEGRVVLRQAPTKHLVHLSDAQYDVDQGFELAPSGEGTRVTYTRRLDRKKGGFGLMTGMVRKGTQKSMARELEALKRLLDG